MILKDSNGTPKRRYCICQSLKSLKELVAEGETIDWLINSNGQPANEQEINAAITDAEAKGYTVLPPCNNIKSTGHCAGHDIHITLEEYLDTEFASRKTNVKVRHFLPDIYKKNTAKHGISAVTIAYVDEIDEEHITNLLHEIEIECWNCNWTLKKKARMIADELKNSGYAGTAVTTNPQPKRIRRTIVKGLLLKHMRGA